MLPTQEVDTLTEMLLSGYRLDGRSINEYREISFRFPQGKDPNISGCCVVKIGATTVMAQVSVEVIEPKHFRPSQGMLFVHFDASILKLSKTVFRKQKRDDEGRRLSAVLQTLLRDCIDLDALCIVAWERVFAIRVELRALSYDGNLGDCGALAAVAALSAFRRPDVYVDDMGKVLVDFKAKFRPRVPLSIRRIPVLVTLGLTPDAKVILVDPTAREELILTGGRVLLGLTNTSEICCLYTTGLTVPIQCSSLSRCIRLANSKAKSLVSLIDWVVEGLSVQREANLAAGHARSSELGENALAASYAPLVLSTSTFLQFDSSNQVNDKVNVNREEGEILETDISHFNSDNDMDVVSSEEDTHSDAKSPAKHGEKTKLLPYGVIEVSNSVNEISDTIVPNSSETELYEFDSADIFNAESLTSRNTSQIFSETFKGDDNIIESAYDKDEEEENVTILNLT
ncbi:Exosome complex component RRP45 [Schistosoma japonicum]|uniref:Exosome complex component RRP45 n=3 Tax=Schistosoma japonicum TaxID=6182 RepID=A0A4Z2D7Y9_SCHJA|nr:Exosome complex component RRP45 [Schistosoma japonicum]KAH8862448.1 Exosome complex component RRP45 [Schistosoma japonicum]KAH8862449.1 Exosome complex component RRP45 [Schistosoma japonicum]TNN12611.1 Exosome complex component RRP45 [Schistosoma japonicum]TNN12612.1 Exosome complex component RRP45 [Schistosoma japonicum]